jgi:hypothetical protein
MFKVPEKYRIKSRKHPMGTDSSYGNNGCFQIPLSNSVSANIIASDGEGWEHVSVHINDLKINKMKNGGHQQRIPTWSEMCKIKDLFWGDKDCVVQYHPPKSEYVNDHKFTLHLWRPVNSSIPIPDTSLIGLLNK